MIYNTNKRHQFENCKRKMLSKIKRNAEQFFNVYELNEKTNFKSSRGHCFNSIKCCDLQSFKYGLDKTVTLSKPD